MINWREYPFVRLLLPLILGILFSFLWMVALPSYVFIILSLPIIGLTYLKGQYKYRTVYGFLVTIFIFCLGHYLGFHADESRSKDHYHHFLNEDETRGMVATVMDVRVTAKSYRVELAIQAMSGVEERPISGKLLSYFEQSKAAGKLKYGDHIYFSTRVNPIAGSSNPEAFDLKEFLGNRNFHFQTYVKTNEWKLLARDQGNPLIAFSIRTRDRLFNILGDHLSTANELAVGAALILGKKDLLELN